MNEIISNSVNECSVSNKGMPLDVDVNVDIKVKNNRGKLLQHIMKHNKATSNMTEGIVRFLRGEFNKTAITSSIATVGMHANEAQHYIPTYIGIGNIGVRANNEIMYDANDDSQYSDTSLRREIFPYKRDIGDSSGANINSRISIARSTSSNSNLSDTYQLVISGYYQFNSDFNFYYGNGKAVKEFATDKSGNKSFAITEFGLFSGNVDDYDAKLLARLLLDPKTPLIVDSTSTVIVNWTLGVYSLDDMILNTSKNSGYKYIQKTTEAKDAEFDGNTSSTSTDEINWSNF